MNLSKPSLFRKVFLGVIEDDGQAESNRESEKGEVVLTTFTEHPNRTEGTPEYRGGEKGVDTGASHFKWCCRGTDSFNLVHLEIEDTDAYE
jgi:hypothetical protein